MKQITHILWDWNGTLLDDVPACVRALNIMLRRRSLKEVSHRDYRERFHFPVIDYYRDLGFDFESDDWDTVALDYHKLYRRFSTGSPLRAGADRALAALREKGLAMSVLSASNIDLLSVMVSARGIAGFFDGLYGLPNYYADSKVAAGRQFLKTAAVNPENVLVIGDTVHDSEVADELNCRCLLLKGGHQSEERLRRTGCNIAAEAGEAVEYLARW
ncbi:MAG: HAD hydrolase-like protein [Kiritimatiellia bacterium]